MKTSLLIILIIVNTTALISEPLTNLISGVNTWWFIGAELFLLALFYLHKTIKGLQKECTDIFNDFSY